MAQSLNARKIEAVMKDVNTRLQNEGVLELRSTLDIWTKLMSTLMQGEYQLAIPVRKDLQEHIRKKRADKIYTFNFIIQRLDEILDRYIPPPQISQNTNEKKQIKKVQENNSKSTKSDGATSHEKQTSITLPNQHPRKNVSHSSERQKAVEETFSLEEYKFLQSNERVFRRTIEDQQMKIKSLEETVDKLEKQFVVQQKRNDTRVKPITPLSLVEDPKIKPTNPLCPINREIIPSIRTNPLQPVSSLVTKVDISLQTDREKTPEKILTKDELRSMRAERTILIKTIEDQQSKLRKLETNVASQQREIIDLRKSNVVSPLPSPIPNSKVTMPIPMAVVAKSDSSQQTDSSPTDKHISREEFFMAKANESVLMKTIEDQQTKIQTMEGAIHTLEKKNTVLIEELKCIGKEKDGTIDVYNKAEKEIKFLRNELRIKDRTLQQSLMERNELLDRLNSISSTKLASGAFNVTDLSDYNRPTKLAEKYTQLFDGEWTDAFHILTLEMTEEKIAIQWLLEILQDSYKFCSKTNDSHTKLLIENTLYPFTRLADHTDVDATNLDEITKTLINDLKKVTAKDAVAQIQVKFLKHMQGAKNVKKFYENKMATKLMSYIDQCTELCWLMVSQIPPLYFDENSVKSGDEFDRDKYRFHTVTGSKYDYLVWPALLIHPDGLLLSPGVAQPKPEGVALRITSTTYPRMH